MGDQEEKVTTGQGEQPVSGPQENSLGIYVFGDRARDEILIPAREPSSGKTASGAHDGQFGYRAEKYTAACGVDLLQQIVNSPNEDQKDNSEDDSKNNSKKKWAVETVSEWKLKKDEKKPDQKRLYLQRQNGYMENKNSPVMVDTERLEKARIAVVYNMVSEKFQDAQTKETIEPSKIVSDLGKCEYSIIRARWGKSKLLDALWKNTQASKKAILIFNVDGLRQAGLNIRSGISWEQMVLETKQAVTGMTVETGTKGSEKTEKVLKLCKAVIICMKHEGCMLFCGEEVHLFYYCDEIEGDFVKKKDQTVFGSTSTMQAAVAMGMAKYLEETKKEEDALAASTEIGLMLMRELIEHGYDYAPPEDGKSGSVTYPYKYIYEMCSYALKYRDFGKDTESGDTSADVIKRWKEAWEKERPAQIKFQSEQIKEKEWITNRFVESNNHAENKKLTISLCGEIVERGAAEAHIPYLKLRNLVTFDREEVEHIRSIQRIVEQYKNDPDRKTPLSICVFGRPGSGKSFAVKQIVKSLKVKDEDIFEFNLSQMADVRDLYAAFHQIRDAGLRSGLPVAFFDEFDANIGETKLGWLKYFLAPMQDGEFRENGITHYIGKALFVFAGGTCQSMDELRKKQAQPEMVQQKLPDFLSRIKGYIDVAGPNAIPCPVVDKPVNCWMKAGLLIKGEEDPELHIEDEDREHIHSCRHAKKCCQDQSHYLRRAALLRAQLERKLNIKENDRIKINYRVLDAFLRVEQYKHGARSMDAIVQTSHVEPEQEFNVTSIDSNFLDLYATDDFKRYLRQPPKPDKQSS